MNELPFVRCVGIGTAVFQEKKKKAYDYRMICILSGEGSIEIDSEKCITNQNEMYVINPGTEYRVCSGANQKIAVINFDTTYDFSHIKDPVLSVDIDLFENHLIMDTSKLHLLKDSVYEIPYSALNLLEEMYEVYMREDMNTEIKNFMLSSKLAYIFSKMLDNKKNTNSLSTAIYKYIIDNAYSKLTLEKVAEMFNYSPSYIEKTLRKNYNISFRQLIGETRMKKAIWLLENTSLSCAEISSQLGFYSAQHFTQMFKKKYNKKPTDFR